MRNSSTAENHNSIVLLRHFELFTLEVSVSEKKLRLLESLLRQKKQIIILSSRSFESMAVNGIGYNETPTLKERWSNVLNNFYTLYHNWQPSMTDELHQLKEDTKQDIISYLQPKLKDLKKREEIAGYCSDQTKVLLDRLENECAHSEFLWGLRKPMLEFLKANKLNYLDFYFRNHSYSHVIKMINQQFSLFFEQLCLKIQSLAANYYLSLWQSLSPEEQRTLYDISLDEIINPENRDIAVRLCGLGLAKAVEDVACYEIMNTSFRNFIFTRLDEKEVQNIKSEAAEKGIWNNLQLPVMIVLIAVSLFLFVTQQDAFTHLLTYLGAAAGGIAALLKILGMMPNSKT